MDMYFYGAGQFGLAALRKYNAFDGRKEKLVGFIDNKRNGSIEDYPVCKIDTILSCNVVVVITMDNHFNVCDVYNQLRELGFQYIYWFMNWEDTDHHADFLAEECLNCARWGKTVLPRLEMHIADHCNLNCKGCTHYAPIFEEQYADFDNVIQSVEILKRKLSNIAVLSILGGEPLLNPELPLYVEKLHELLPDSCIQIVTNGLLILKLDAAILECISRNGVIVRISEYKPTHKIIDKIEDRLQEYKITYRIHPYDAKQKFVKPLSLSENSIYPKKCISDGCVNIWNGKIARCPSLMFIEKFNEIFGVNLPKQGIMQLEDCPSGAELLKALQQEVPLCKHCVFREMEWLQCSDRPKLTDFAEYE